MESRWDHRHGTFTEHPVLLIASSLFLFFVDRNEGQLVASRCDVETFESDLGRFEPIYRECIERIFIRKGDSSLRSCLCRAFPRSFIPSFVSSCMRDKRDDIPEIIRLCRLWQNPLRSLYSLFFVHRNEGQTLEVCPCKSLDSTERIKEKERKRRKQRNREFSFS